MNGEISSRLGSLAPLTGVSRETLCNLTRGASIRRYPAGTQIAEHGAAPEFLNVLLEGSVELIGKGRDERESVVRCCEPIDFFFLAAVLTDMPCLLGALAVEPVKVLTISSQTVREGVASDHRLALNLMGVQARQFRSIVRRVKNLNLRTATERLGCYLMLQRERTGSIAFALPVPKRQIAVRLGMTPESVSRAFASLREYGVSVSGREVVLRDPDLVRARCVPDPLIDLDDRERSFPEADT